jgi:hypothetical protein
LRFLFNPMSPKQIEGFPFQGIPKMIYLDNGPVAKSDVFQQVMRYLGIDVCVALFCAPHALFRSPCSRSTRGSASCKPRKPEAAKRLREVISEGKRAKKPSSGLGGARTHNQRLKRAHSALRNRLLMSHLCIMRFSCSAFVALASLARRHLVALRIIWHRILRVIWRWCGSSYLRRY